MDFANLKQNTARMEDGGKLVGGVWRGSPQDWAYADFRQAFPQSPTRTPILPTSFNAISKTKYCLIYYPQRAHAGDKFSLHS